MYIENGFAFVELGKDLRMPDPDVDMAIYLSMQYGIYTIISGKSKRQQMMCRIPKEFGFSVDDDFDVEIVDESIFYKFILKSGLSTRHFGDNVQK